MALQANRKTGTLPGIARNLAAPATPVDEDLRFLDEQARQYLASRVWERLGTRTFELNLKVGSWYEASAQPFAKGPTNLVFLFPGRLDLRALQQAGLGEPPAFTILAELGGSELGYSVITSDGWLPLDRRDTQFLALAFAAITHLDAIGPQAVTAFGDLALPGGVRGRYRVRLAPSAPDADQFIPIFGIAREDLYGDAECTLTLLRLPWTDYHALRQRALVSESRQPIQDLGETIPVVVLSTDVAREVASKLRTAEPLGVTLAEKGSVLSMMLAGARETCSLTDFVNEREQVQLWWHDVKSSAYAVMVSDSVPDGTSDRWDPPTVQGLFEFGRQRSG